MSDTKIKDKVVVNGSTVSYEEFRKIEESVKSMKGQKKLVKLSEGVYKTIVKLED